LSQAVSSALLPLEHFTVYVEYAVPSLVVAFASNTMLVGLAARLPAEKMIRAVAAAILDKFISSSSQFTIGVSVDEISRNQPVR
jgi:hypothetical protein